MWRKGGRPLVGVRSTRERELVLFQMKCEWVFTVVQFLAIFWFFVCLLTRFAANLAADYRPSDELFDWFLIRGEWNHDTTRISQYIVPDTSAFIKYYRLGICRSPPVTELVSKTTCSPPRVMKQQRNNQLCSLLGGWGIMVAFTITTRYLSLWYYLGWYGGFRASFVSYWGFQVRWKGIPGSTLIDFEFFGLVLFCIEGNRCADTSPGTILVDFGIFGLVLFSIEDFNQMCWNFSWYRFGWFWVFRACCWTYSHHCQIGDKNPSKRWNGEFWGFRIRIGFGLAVPPLPHIVFRVCLYNGFLCLISVSFPATTPRATTPHRYLTATTPRATTPVQIHSS